MKSEIVFYLMKHYGLTESRAVNALIRHEEIVADAIRWRSSPYYPADKIAAAEGLEHLNPCDACTRENAV